MAKRPSTLDLEAAEALAGVGQIAGFDDGAYFSPASNTRSEYSTRSSKNKRRRNETESIHIPKLVLVSQSGGTKDKAITNGQARTIFVVVKESAFELQLSMDTSMIAQNAKSYNFSTVVIKCSLVYENFESKEVEVVGKKPLEYTVRANDSGTQAVVTCRISALSSHCGDQFFKVACYAVNSATGALISELMKVVSQPIKVVAKPDKKPEKQKKEVKKRTLNDILLETLTRIESAQQIQQDKMSNIMEILSRNNISASTEFGANALSSLSVQPNGILNQRSHHGNGSSKKSLGSDPIESIDIFGGIKNTFMGDDESKSEKQTNNRPLEFDSAFKDLMDAFNMLDQQSVIEKMKKIKEQKSSLCEQLTELHDLFAAEGLEQELGKEVDDLALIEAIGDNKCDCPECPHKMELQRIEDFYKEVLQG